MVGAYQRGEAVSLTFLGVRETRFAAARDSSSRALAALAGLPERSGCFFFDDELFFELLSALLFVSVFLEPLSFSALFAVFLSELFFETFSELLSASSAADFFSKATLGLLTGWGWWHETTAIHPVLA
ncbi:hypothetical protein HMPREF9057_01753 [Actinomyces sp. oral taxon 171 str. F0337]|nr:hypothetical protein HMPREF9057_01753 [Actinomyces sp. oral taxon 171 str. F0337]